LQGAAAKHQVLELPPLGRLQGRIAAIGGLDGMGKRSVCSFLFSVFGDDGFPFKTKIRTISVNNPAGI